MHTFTYTPDPQNPHDHATVVVSTSAPSLPDVLAAFEAYLLASGFRFDGQLDFVNDQP